MFHYIPVRKILSVIGPFTEFPYCSHSAPLNTACEAELALYNAFTLFFIKKKKKNQEQQQDSFIPQQLSAPLDVSTV